MFPEKQLTHTATAVELPLYETLVLSPVPFLLHSHLPAPWHSFTLCVIKVVSEAAPRSCAHYLHHNRALGHQAGWGPGVPAAIQPLSTKP